MLGWGAVEVLSRLVRKGLVEKQRLWRRKGVWRVSGKAASGRRAPGVFHRLGRL